MWATRVLAALLIVAGLSMGARQDTLAQRMDTGKVPSNVLYQVYRGPDRLGQQPGFIFDNFALTPTLYEAYLDVYDEHGYILGWPAFGGTFKDGYRDWPAGLFVQVDDPPGSGICKVVNSGPGTYRFLMLVPTHRTARTVIEPTILMQDEQPLAYYRIRVNEYLNSSWDGKRGVCPQP